MLETLNGNKLEYQRLSPEEMKERGILGRLIGVCADTISPTRNGRKYSESLWEKVFDNPIMKEKIKNKVCYGELNHPFDGREEVDMEKIAINLTEQPKKNKDGKLVAVFDVLDTPNGRVLDTLARYGSVMGVSSRGNGDTFVNRDGDEEVNEDTYECTGFDIVPVPAVESARLQYVTESLNNKSLKQALMEQLNNEKDLTAKRVMTETIKSLNIDSSDIENKQQVNQETLVANNAGTNVVEDLQEALKTNKELEQKVAELQEKLSVCYAKETKIESSVNKYRSTIVNLSEQLKQVDVLREQLKQKDEQIANNEQQINRYKEKYSELRENKSEFANQSKQLTESLNESKTQIRELRRRISELNETIKNNEQSFEKEKNALQEQLEGLKSDSSIKASEYSEKIEKANSLVEKYRRIAQKSIDKYVESKANMIGVSSMDIKNRLSENYSFNDIDEVCEELKKYKVNLNKLPIDLQAVKRNTAKVTVNESKQSILNGYEDDLTESDLKVIDNFI